MNIFFLWHQVTSIEKSVSGGSKVAEVQITTLIELLMRHAVKLESIPAEADTSSQKNLQVPYMHCTHTSFRGTVPLVPALQLLPLMRGTLLGLSASAIRIIALAGNASSAMTSGAMQVSTRNATCGRVPYMPPGAVTGSLAPFWRTRTWSSRSTGKKTPPTHLSLLRMLGR